MMASGWAVKGRLGLAPMDHAMVKDKLRLGAEGIVYSEDPWPICILTWGVQEDMWTRGWWSSTKLKRRTMALWHLEEVRDESTSGKTKTTLVKTRMKVKASDLSGWRTSINIGESHLTRCAWGFAGLILKIGDGCFRGLCLKPLVSHTQRGVFTRVYPFGPQNRGCMVWWLKSQDLWWRVWSVWASKLAMESRRTCDTITELTSWWNEVMKVLGLSGALMTILPLSGIWAECFT